MGTKSSSWISKSAALFRKDLISEFRTRYAINAVVLFAITTLTAVSFSVGGVGAKASPSILSAFLWIVLFFSAMSGLSRVFVREEETGTSSALRLTTSSTVVYTGKLIFNLALLMALEVVVVPLYVLMMSVSVRDWGLFLAVILLGSIGLSAAATIVAAIVSKANAKGALFAVLSFPILMPLLFTAIHGTRLSLEPVGFSAGLDDIRILIAYAGITITASVMLFKFVWED